MVKKKLKLILRFGVSCLFVGYLALKVDWTVILFAFKQIDLGLYAASTILTLGASFFLACKYHLLIKGTSLARPVLYLTKINLIIRFYALFLPSALGPEAVRWYKITRNQRERSLFLAAIVFERLTFILMLILCSFIPLFFYSSNLEIESLRQRIFPVVIVSLSFVCLSLCYFIFPEIRSFFLSIVEQVIPSRWNSQNIDIFLKSLYLNNTNASLYSYVTALSLVWQFFFLSRLFVLFKAAYLPLSFLDVAWMGSLVLILQVLPISFAGIGVREGAYAYLFTLYNLPAEKGVVIGILIFSQMLILAGLGAFFELRD